MSGNTWRLLVIVAVLVVSFLVAFQPIGRPSQEVISTFRVSFSEPISNAQTDQTKLISDLKADLKAGGVGPDELDQVRVINDRQIEVSTLALDQQQASTDKQNIGTALTKAYPKRKVTVSLPPGVGEERQPIFKIGNALALYRPIPRIHLGLDLQGGAYVVLRCLSYGRMVFTVPNTNPFYLPAAQADRTGIAPGWKPVETQDSLTKRVLKALNGLGVMPAEVKVQIVSPTMISVTTHPADQRELTKQQKTILAALQQAYPTLKPDQMKADTSDAVFLGKDTAAKVKTVIDRRLYAMSEIREPVIQVQGADRIIVQLPGVRDPDRVLRILRSTAMLEFVLIPARYEQMNPDSYDEWKDKTTGQIVPWEQVLAQSQVKFTGRDLQSNSDVEPGQAMDWVVGFHLKTARKRAFYNFTRENVGRLMAIVLDNKCQMAPVIKSAIPGDGIIEGHFTADQAKDLKLLLNAGALPVPLEVAENRTVSPTLGRDSVMASFRAGLIGCLAILAFMIFYYRLPGLMADIALGIYVTLTMALLVIVHATLTLPGVAGFIISIGMAVDANVLIFERLKEELWAGKGMRAAVEAGFHRAWTAILDSNVTTLIAAAVLYFLGTSSVKSFAVTLFWGVLASMFTAVTVSRWLLEIVGSTRLGQHLHLYTHSAHKLAASEASSRPTG